jgi:hypothetical protein
MAVESRTIGDLVSRVHFHLANTANASSELKTEIKWALYYSMLQMVTETDHPAYEAESTVSAATSTADYELAADFQRIIEPGVKHDSPPQETLHMLDQQRHDELEGDRLFEGENRPRFYIMKGRARTASSTTGHQIMRLVPTPETTYTINYSYFAKPVDQSAAADGDELDQRFPREFVDGIIDGALWKLRQFLTREQSESAFVSFNEWKGKMRKAAKSYTGRVFKARRYGGAPQFPGYRPTGLSGTDLSH